MPVVGPLKMFGVSADFHTTQTVDALQVSLELNKRGLTRLVQLLHHGVNFEGGKLCGH